VHSAFIKNVQKTESIQFDTTSYFMRAESEGNYGMQVILSTKWGIDYSYLCQ